MDDFEEFLEKKKRHKQPKPKGLKRGGPLKRTPLNPVSKKQKKRNKAYKHARDQHYAQEENQSCAMCGKGEHLSIHHKEGRGSQTANQDTFITLCCFGSEADDLYPHLNSCNGMGCHQKIEANKSWARTNNYL